MVCGSFASWRSLILCTDSTGCSEGGHECSTRQAEGLWFIFLLHCPPFSFSLSFFLTFTPVLDLYEVILYATVVKSLEKPKAVPLPNRVIGGSPVRLKMGMKVLTSKAL